MALQLLKEDESVAFDMAYDDTRESLIGNSVEASNQPKDKSNAVQRRRHRRNSASVDNIPEQNGTEPHLLESTKEPTFRKILIVLAAYLGVGSFGFFLLRNQLSGKKTNGLLDALYFCVVTMTTLGYGDLVPSSTLAKLLASAYVFAGMALGGLILSKAADYILEKQEVLLARAMHMNEKVGPAEIQKEVEAHKIRYKFLTSLALLLVLTVLGTVFLSVVEKFKFVDAFYCVCATMTTLGYGDESFSTTGGRIFAVFWILASTVCVAQFFFYFTEMYTENRQRSFIKWVLTRNVTCSDLEAADLDQDKVLSAAEFVVYKLQEMGKISKEDVTAILERFQNLDVDHSGTLTSSDLIQSRN
ncbi:two-pore potassium channel 1-like isoform X1 [Rhodamnia argentea]|uniref:Two-pore potassium channel 1-like isoform X1 n=2 Tax=Rhodamnia argentea TaxID=178133 RepID=A0ABM3HWE1_9MYRT|nr:two-pore potassium channel 1-like isoform X1 [Rhodamnia argentea]